MCNGNNNIAKQSSKAYGYNYTSLADFARQGYEIPIMRTVVNEFGEFIEWFDKATKEWHQGARVIQTKVLPKGNDCQHYGSALSYARRYTVAMALGLATDDDDAIEQQAPQQSKPKPQPKTDPLEAQVTALYKQVITKMPKEAVDEAVKTITQGAQLKECDEQTINKLIEQLKIMNGGN